MTSPLSPTTTTTPLPPEFEPRSLPAGLLAGLAAALAVLLLAWWREGWLAARLGVDRLDVARWEVLAIRHAVRPGYLLLCAVHAALWGVMRAYGPRTGRQRALARFVVWKGALWAYFWLSSAYAPPQRTRLLDPGSMVWWNAALIVLIAGVLGTSVEVLIRFAHRYVWRPLRTRAGGRDADAGERMADDLVHG